MVPAPPSLPLAVADLLALHDAPVVAAVEDAIGGPAARAPSAGALAAAAEGHVANAAIWGLEDEARRRDVADARIAALKRAIDAWNQRRNDLMEEVDAHVLAHFASIDAAGARLHSETAGMMVDRLSILALKVANMLRVGGEASAAGDAALAVECAGRATRLAAQRRDLALCLGELLDDFAAGRRVFRPYRQLKAYNDPRTNLALRAAAARPEGE